jgi:integrase
MSASQRYTPDNIKKRHSALKREAGGENRTRILTLGRSRLTIRPHLLKALLTLVDSIDIMDNVNSFDVKFDLLLVPSWFDYCKRHYSPATCSHYFNTINQINKYCPDHLLDRATLEQYLNDLLIKNSRRTHNSNLTVFRSFGRWYHSQLNVQNFSLDVSFIKEDPPNRRILSDDEYELILKSVHGIQLDIILFLSNTGLRKTEFRTLKWVNISQDSKFITIVGKGRKRRVIPLNQTCKEILQRYKRDTNPPEFTQRYKGRNGLTQFCEKLAKRIGIPSFGTHTFRHLFASRLINAGIPIPQVSQILVTLP